MLRIHAELYTIVWFYSKSKHALKQLFWSGAKEIETMLKIDKHHNTY